MSIAIPSLEATCHSLNGWWSLTTSDHTEARVKYNEWDGESDGISLSIQTSHEARWSDLKHRLMKF